MKTLFNSIYSVFKKFRKVLILFFALNLYFACQINSDEKSDIINEIKSKNIVFAKDLQACIIIPEVGCGGCISGGVEFIKNNKNRLKEKHKTIKIIFTSILSIKMLHRILEIKDFENYHFTIDTLNKYRFSSNIAIYPMIIYLKEGEIYDIKVQSPENPDALSNFEKVILYE